MPLAVVRGLERHPADRDATLNGRRLVYFWTAMLGETDEVNETVQPCPFCSCPMFAMLIIPGGVHVIVCTHCGASGPSGRTPLLAIELWNGAQRLLGHARCSECGLVASVHSGGRVVPIALRPTPIICPVCRHEAEPELKLNGTGTLTRPGKGVSLFCCADTLLSEQDGSFSVRRVEQCTCQR